MMGYRLYRPSPRMIKSNLAIRLPRDSEALLVVVLIGVGLQTELIVIWTYTPCSGVQG